MSARAEGREAARIVRHYAPLVLRAALEAAALVLALAAGLATIVGVAP